MSFREKSVWISLLSMLAIYGYYFWSVAPSGAPGKAGAVHSVPLLIATIGVLVAVQVLLHAVVALHRPDEARAPRDEREKLIALKATRIAFYGLASGVVLACIFGALDPPIAFDTNSLLFVLVAAEVLRSACQIIYFRRGA